MPSSPHAIEALVEIIYRAWAEAHCDRWYILSAKHGLVAPTSKLDPYDESLESRSEQERREWAWRVFHQIRDLREQQMFPGPDEVSEIVFLTGHNYRRYLAGDLRAAGYTVTEPLAGLPYARQVAKLKQWLQEGPMLNVSAGQPAALGAPDGSHLDAILQEIAAEVVRQRELAALARSLDGLVIISGYPSALYEEMYDSHGWQRVERRARTNNRNGETRIEGLWLSPRTAQALETGAGTDQVLVQLPMWANVGGEGNSAPRHP